MGTTFTIYLYSPNRIEAEADFEAAFEEIERVEEALSNYRPTSELSRINRLAGLQRVTTDPEVWYNYRLLQVWDRLSIQFAFRLAADGEIAPLPRLDGPDEALRIKNVGPFAVTLDPYPFDDSPRTFPLAARLLPDRPYRDAEEWLAAVAAAPLTTLECRASRR